jgi:hypothetical protein
MPAMNQFVPPQSQYAQPMQQVATVHQQQITTQSTQPFPVRQPLPYYETVATTQGYCQSQYVAAAPQPLEQVAPMQQQWQGANGVRVERLFSTDEEQANDEKAGAAFSLASLYTQP